MLLEEILKNLSSALNKQKVSVPALWIGSSSNKPVITDYAVFLSNAIKEITGFHIAQKRAKDIDWTRRAVIYNIFVRYFTSYDHDQDGIIGQDVNDITINKTGIRETGTFLKTLALLPYLHKLGINTIHLLPITKIGIEGRKGDLGSPYAIKNPFEIDPNLADLIIDIPIENQYEALIEGAHRLGMKVVQEFIFRTVSIDSDWSVEHPEWFYWVKDDCNYSAPKFNKKELTQIIKIPKGKGRFIPPHKAYRKKYINPLMEGELQNSNIASAFADWPPDDLQPPWTDVTYLRLYNYDYRKENNYNYIAYNTIRFYDPELAQNDNINHDLWNKIREIIPYYQKTFGIDGAMIDMGHALPDNLKFKIIERARKIDPEFAFWDENFDNKKDTKKDGYNAVIGDDWYKITRRNGFRKIIESSKVKKPLAYFGTAETHNTPRFGIDNPMKKKAAWLLFNVLPGAVPFLHNGYELNEQLPVNTGLNFTMQQISQLSHQNLPLFFKNSMNWDSEINITAFIKKIAGIRNKYPWVFNNEDISIIRTDNSKVLGFNICKSTRQAIILFNTNFYKKEVFSVGELTDAHFIDVVNKKPHFFTKKNQLKKGEFIMAVLV